MPAAEAPTIYPSDREANPQPMLLPDDAPPQDPFVSTGIPATQADLDLWTTPPSPDISREVISDARAVDTTLGHTKHDAVWDEKYEVWDEARGGPAIDERTGKPKLEGRAGYHATKAEFIAKREKAIDELGKAAVAEELGEYSEFPANAVKEIVEIRRINRLANAFMRSTMGPNGPRWRRWATAPLAPVRAYYQRTSFTLEQVSASPDQRKHSERRQDWVRAKKQYKGVVARHISRPYLKQGRTPRTSHFEILRDTPLAPGTVPPIAETGTGDHKEAGSVAIGFDEHRSSHVGNIVMSTDRRKAFVDPTGKIIPIIGVDARPTTPESWKHGKLGRARRIGHGIMRHFLIDLGDARPIAVNGSDGQAVRAIEAWTAIDPHHMDLGTIGVQTDKLDKLSRALGNLIAPPPEGELQPSMVGMPGRATDLFINDPGHQVRPRRRADQTRWGERDANSRDSYDSANPRPSPYDPAEQARVAARVNQDRRILAAQLRAAQDAADLAQRDANQRARDAADWRRRGKP